MAARIRKIRHDEETRARIKTSQLINRLTNHAVGKVKLTSTQVRAIEVLLDRSLPKLTAVELSGAGGGPVQYSDMTDDQINERIAQLIAVGSAKL